MYVVIDIPEVDYNYAKQQVADGITNPLKIFIASGTPIPDNTTNGDIRTAIEKEMRLISQRSIYIMDNFNRGMYEGLKMAIGEIDKHTKG